MSIINEALKKAGQPILADTKKESFRPELLKKKGRISWGPLFVVAILVLVTTPILAPVFHAPAGRSSQAGTKIDSPNMKAQFAVEEAPILPMAHMTPRAVTGPDFLLNGLIYSNEGSYCLINGKVVKVGDSVGGAVLKSVTPSQAVLDYRGERIVLPVNA